MIAEPRHPEVKGAETAPLTLSEAIEHLEAGVRAAISIDLGNGRIIHCRKEDAHHGLLQRLKGHRLLTALAEGRADLPKLPRADMAVIPENVQIILDAVRQSD